MCKNTETYCLVLQVSEHENGCYAARICQHDKVLVELPARFVRTTDAAATALLRLSSDISWATNMGLGASEEMRAKMSVLNGEQNG